METIGQLLRYIGFVASNFRIFYLVAVLTLLALILEYSATSLMIPMAPGHASASSHITLIWTKVANYFGLKPVSRTWLWLFFIIMMIRLVFGYILSVLTTWLGKRVHESFSGKVFSHILLREPMVRVYTRTVGHYITMAGDDTFKSGMIISTLLQSSVGFFTAVVGMIVLYQFSHTVFSGLILFLLFCLIAIGVMLKRLLSINVRAINLSRELGTNFVEALNSLRSIRSLHGERFVIGGYAAQIHSYVKLLVELDAIKIGARSFPAVLLLLLTAIAIRPGVKVDMTSASLFAGTVIVIRIFASLGQMMTAASQLMTDLRSVKNIGELVELAREDQEVQAVEKSSRVRNVCLQHIYFGYDGREKILDDVNFNFNHGYTYAIVGPSGSGKSTLADIILGLSEPQRGNVLVNNGDVPLMSARTRFSLVEQQPKIFSNSIKDNLLLGNQGSDDELFEALEVVNLDDMIRSLDDGLDTRLTYLGENFSGGQRQRLGIARALLRKPDVLLLDEATSALDPATRIEIVGKLRAKMKDGIIIFITHDQEIAALADEVLAIGEPVMAFKPDNNQVV